MTRFRARLPPYILNYYHRHWLTEKHPRMNCHRSPIVVKTVPRCKETIIKHSLTTCYYRQAFLTFFLLNRNSHDLHPASPIPLPVSPSKIPSQTIQPINLPSKRPRNKGKTSRGTENTPRNPVHLIFAISSRFPLPKFRAPLSPMQTAPPFSMGEGERKSTREPCHQITVCVPGGRG